MLTIANRQGNANQNKNEISCHTCQNGYHQKEHRDFPGGPVGKTSHSQCRGPGFYPWSGN